MQISQWNRKEATDALRKAIEQHRSEVNGASSVTFSAFFDRWLEEHAKHRCAPKTLERYVQLGRHATKFLGDTELQKLVPLAIESVLNSLLDSGGRKDQTHPDGQPLSARTVRHVAFLIHDSLECAVRWGILSANPMDRVVLPKAEKKEIRALDKLGLSQLLEAVRATSLYPLFVMAASTGCRRGELLAIEWKDIDFQTGIVTISKSLEQTRSGLRIKTTKSGKPRRFPLPLVTLRVLLEHRQAQRTETPGGKDLDLVFLQS